MSRGSGRSGFIKSLPVNSRISVESLAECKFHFRAKLFSSKLMSWYRQGRKEHPWRSDWCEFKDPYRVWVSEIMLQQTTISVVAPIYLKFLRKFPTVEDLARGCGEEVREQVRGLGYYRRFRMLHEGSRIIAKQFSEFRPEAVSGERRNVSIDPLEDEGQFSDDVDGKWPVSFADWKKLPGVGSYTAAAVVSIAFGVPVPVVDGNVERVMCRLFDLRIQSNHPELKKVFFAALSKIICLDHPGDFNQAIMELGQTLCTPKSPKCVDCSVSYACLSYRAGSQPLAPAAKPKKVFEKINLCLFIFQDHNRFALVERPSRATFLKGTSGFLTGLITGSILTQSDEAKEMSSFFDTGLTLDGHFSADIPSEWVSGLVAGVRKAGRFKHSITKYKIAAEVFVVDKEMLPAGVRCSWVSRDRIEQSLVSNLDRKAWVLFGSQRVK